MTTKNVVADEALGQLSRRIWDFQRRVQEGTIPLDYALRGMQWIIEQRPLVLTQPPVLQLVESFDPAEFRTNLTLWRGPKDGNGLKGAVEVYEPADLKEVNPDRILFEHFLTDADGNSIRGEIKLDRAKESKKILLGGRTCLSFWRDCQTNGENSVLEWLRRNKGITWMDFPGVVLRSSVGDRCLLGLCFHGRVWCWAYVWLDDDWDRVSPSAVLEQVSS